MRAIRATLVAAFAVAATTTIVGAAAVCGPPAASNGSSPFLGPDQRAMLFVAFNDILGSKQNMSFTDPSVTETLARMNIGGLRHPGGTVANYWSFANASFVQPCSMTGLYDFCDSQAALAAYPAQSFSPANFTESVGARLVPNAGGADDHLRVVFDLNLLTLSEEDAIAQVDVLAATIPNASHRVRFIELGNEYYLTKHYSHWFPNATAYMQKATGVIARVRQLLPNAQIAAVTSRDNGAWNTGVAPFAGLIDAVTIHDYSGYLPRKDLGEDATWEGFVLHGPAVVPAYATTVRSTFGADKKIWMTEFNAQEEVTAFMPYTVGHMLFVLNYLFSGACETQGTVQVMMMHMLWGQVDNWGKTDGPVLLPLESNSPGEAKYNAMAQLFARIASHSSDVHLTAECLDFGASAGCPTGEARDGTTVSCMRGIRFTRPNGATHYVITQGCAANATISLDIAPGVTAYVHSYFHWQTGDPTEFQSCDATKSLWECAPLKPHVEEQLTGSASGVSEVTLPHLTITFIDVYP
jgi:hypothetical protein